MSVVVLISASKQTSTDVAEVPILLQKRLAAFENDDLVPLMRFAMGDAVCPPQTHFEAWPASAAKAMRCPR
jgi:hypothetical protein